MNLVNNMFFFRACDQQESLMRDSECLYINHLIEKIGQPRASLIRVVADYGFIYMDMPRQLFFAVIKEIGESCFEENAQHFIYHESSVVPFLPKGFISKEDTTRFYLKHKALLMQWLSDYDYGDGGDRSTKEMARTLMSNTALKYSKLTHAKVMALIGTDDVSADGFAEYASAIALKVLSAVCINHSDVVDDYPELSAIDTFDGHSSAF